MMRCDPQASRVFRSAWAATIGWLTLWSTVAATHNPRAWSADGAATRSAASTTAIDLSQLSADEKQDLLRRKEQFDQLPAAERERLRQLHQEVTTSPEAEQLTSVMSRYHAWLQSLSSLERDELLSKPPEQRIEAIKKLMRDQEQKRFKQLAEQVPAEDLDVILRWMDAFVTKHQERILAGIHPEFRRRWEQIEDPLRKKQMLLVSLRMRPPGSEPVLPTQEDFQGLMPKLSKQSQEALKASKQPAELVKEWVSAAMMSKFLPPVSEEQLAKYFKELPIKEREALEKLSPKELQERLTRMYHASQFRQGGDGHRPGFWGPPGMRRPGEGDSRRPFGDLRGGPEGRGPDGRSGPGGPGGGPPPGPGPNPGPEGPPEPPRKRPPGPN